MWEYLTGVLIKQIKLIRRKSFLLELKIILETLRKSDKTSNSADCILWHANERDLEEPPLFMFKAVAFSCEASTVLCSFVKHAESGRARRKAQCRGKHEMLSSVLHYFLRYKESINTGGNIRGSFQLITGTRRVNVHIKL